MAETQIVGGTPAAGVKHCGWLTVTRELLAQAFNLPANAKLDEWYLDPTTQTLTLIIDSPDLPATPLGQVLPRLSIEISVETGPRNPHFSRFIIG